jgi:hypothetical protein
MVLHDPGFLEIAFKALGFQTHAEEFGHVLESALFVRRTVSAVHIMNREKKAKGAALKVSHGGSVGLDYQRPSHPDGAGGNRLSLDFDEAQPAGGVRMLHAFKITEIGDINAVAEAGFEQNSSLRDFKRFIIDHDLDHETPQDGLLAATKKGRSPGRGVWSLASSQPEMDSSRPSPPCLRTFPKCGADLQASRRVCTKGLLP